MANFEVIEIVDDSNPYPVLLGIDWAIEMNGVINLKKWKMIFEKEIASRNNTPKIQLKDRAILNQSVIMN